MATAVLGNCSGGLNTKAPAHKLADNEVRKAAWADLTYDGGISKAKGMTTWLSSVKAGPTKSMKFADLNTPSGLFSYGFLQVFGDMYLAYDWPGAWTINTGVRPIYLYEPSDFTAVVQVSGAVGPNLVAGTTYEYLISVVDVSGNQTPSVIVSAVEGGTAYPIVLSARGCYSTELAAAVTYKVYKRVAAGAWGLLASGLSHAQVDMGGGRVETRVTYTDDGNTATTPASIPVGYNAFTYYCGGRDGLGDWVPGSFLQLNNKMYYISQGSLIYYDPSGPIGKFYFVKPAAHDATYGPNLLADFTSALHKCSKLKQHQNYFFLANNDEEPLTLFWSKLGSIDYWPSAAFIEAPESTYGRILDITPVYDVLSVQLSSGRYTLHGKTFTPDSANFDGYWSRTSDVGVGASESVAVVPAKGRDLVVSLSLETERNVLGLFANTTVESYWNTMELASQIQSKTESDLTCLADMTDWNNAFGIFYDDRYILCFPADQKIWIGYPDRREDGRFSWFGPYDISVKVSCFAIGPNQELFAGGSAGLIIYQIFNGYARHDGTAYTMTVRSRTEADPRGDRAVRRVRARYKKESANSSMSVKAYTDGTLTATEAVSCITGNGAEPEVDLSTLRDRGNARYYEISNAVAGESLTVYSITEEADLKRR